MDKKKLLLIDFNNVFYSHYYTKVVYNSKHQPIQAIQGMIFRMKNLREMFDPDYIVIAKDVSREKTFRRKMYPAYKGKRSNPDENAIFQINSMIRIFALMGYPIISNEEYEADDIIGMCSKLADDLGMETVIVSADKDVYQLISPNTSVWSFRQNEIIDMAYMIDNYKLTPDQWVDVKILQGDQSDNIPGIGGIGQKTAIQLIRGFGSIKDLYNNLDKLSKNLSNRLIDEKRNIPLFRELVTIVRDYTLLDITEKSFERQEIFANEVYDEIIDLELPSTINTVKYDLLPLTYNRE